MTEAPALEARSLVKDYGGLTALEELDLTIGSGALVALAGHNGSGKSTLLRMAAGLLDPSSGEILVHGDPAGSINARASVSYLPDNPVLYDDLSVLEHLEYVSRLHDAEDWEEHGRELLERLHLADRADDLPSRFSRGLRQKTSIALGLVRPFDVLLVDEPFVGLDPSGKDTMVELLREARDDGATVVVATHQLEFVSIADRLVALRDGAVVHDGDPAVADLHRLLEP